MRHHHAPPPPPTHAPACHTPGCRARCPQHYKELLSPRTRLVSLVHVSNMLGAVLDTDCVVEEAKKVGRCKGG